jgi:hypothetical protein
MKPRLLIRQHRSIERQLHALRAAPDGGDALRAHLVEDLSIHCSAELDVLHPAIHVAAGIGAPEVLLLERARELLHVVADGPTAGPAAYRDGLEELAAVFERHVEAQEVLLFPICEERLDDETFRKIMDDVAVVSFRLASTARIQPGRSLSRDAG